MMRQPLDVVDCRIELLLPVYFFLASEREPVQPLVASLIAEHRFYRGKLGILAVEQVEPGLVLFLSGIAGVAVR